MFGSTAQSVTRMVNSLPALQELSSHQEPVEQQKKTGKKAGHWAKAGKFKVAAKIPVKSDRSGKSAMRDNEAGPKPKKKTPYELRDEGLKTERSKFHS